MFMRCQGSKNVRARETNEKISYLWYVRQSHCSRIRDKCALTSSGTSSQLKRDASAPACKSHSLSSAFHPQSG